jgi:predicted nucleic-acid-binding protein
MDRESDIVKSVFLLKMLKRDNEESMDDVIKSLANTGMFTVAEGEKVRDALVKEGYIVNDSLSIKGMMEAKKAEAEFKL